MVHITGPIRCTDRLLVWYIQGYTEHTDTRYTEMYWCTTRTDPLSDRYIPPTPTDTLWYVKPWFDPTLDLSYEELVTYTSPKRSSVHKKQREESNELKECNKLMCHCELWGLGGSWPRMPRCYMYLLKLEIHVTHDLDILYTYRNAF